MDLDAFVIVHRDRWERLDRLARRRRLSGPEADELVTLYQRTATHLSAVRTEAPDPVVVARLSRSVAAGRAALAGGAEPWPRELARWATVSFPAAVYRARWVIIAVALLSLAVAVAMGVWTAHDPRVEGVVGTPAEVRELVDSGFAQYYREHAASSFALQVWTNNAWVAAQCVALGVTGLGVVAVLGNNVLNLGVVGGVMVAHGRAGEFFGLLLPHGLLELTCVFVAAGAGLRLFWAWVDPGPLPRTRRMAQEGRAMTAVVPGLAVVLGVCGAIEAFVTPSGLPTGARIGIGVLAWSLFVGYVAWFGGRAVRAGETGDLGRELVGDVRPVAG